jgi:hypothetical protein
VGEVRLAFTAAVGSICSSSIELCVSLLPLSPHVAACVEGEEVVGERMRDASTPLAPSS